MDPRTSKQADPEIRVLSRAVGGFLLWMITFVVSARALEGRPQSAVVRGLLVALGAAGVLACAWTMRRLIVTRDEYSRQVHFSALALAFAVSVVAVFAIDLLQRAGFLSYLPLMWMWIGMVVIWWLCINVANRYYR
jgi:hypothetical protein